jgi:hypothetical protein
MFGDESFDTMSKNGLAVIMEVRVVAEKSFGDVNRWAYGFRNRIVLCQAVSKFRDSSRKIGTTFSNFCA